MARRQPRPGSLGQRHGPNIQRTASQFFGQQRTFGIVDIHHRRLQTRPRKQHAFGSPVGVHVAVVIQMVLREIGKDRHRHLRTAQAMLDDTDGRCLDRASAVAFVHKAAKRALQQYRVGRGHTRHIQLMRRDPHPQSAHHRAAAM